MQSMQRRPAACFKVRLIPHRLNIAICRQNASPSGILAARHATRQAKRTADPGSDTITTKRQNNFATESWQPRKSAVANTKDLDMHTPDGGVPFTGKAAGACVRKWQFGDAPYENTMNGVTTPAGKTIAQVCL